MLKTYYNMKQLSPNVKVVETKHGFHIIGEFRNRKPQSNIDIRRLLSDCRNRLELDEGRLSCRLPELIDTLFEEKFYDREWSGESEYNIMSQSFWGIKVGKK